MTSDTAQVRELPAAITSFVGRRREVTEVRRLLGATRLLTLTGAGGVGKTRLALEAAGAGGRTFPQGVWLVDMASVRDPGAVASAAATALELPDLGARSDMERLTGYLAGRRALIVLDNCEHLVGACADLAMALLSAAPELRILATSRQTLQLTGEWVFTVPPLAPEDAVELLRDRTTAVNAAFRITEANRAQILRLCTDLDGLPLAIELAASRLRILSVEQVVDRLKDRFTLLSSGSRAALPRQRTLRAAIDWSYELCAPAERLLWNRLSAFVGDFTLDAAEGVCAGDGISRHEVLDLLDQLVSQSIVLTTEREGPPRYRLLETIRQYGWERLAESGEEARLFRRHRDFYLALAEGTATDWFGPGQEQAMARLRAEHDNLLAALDYAAQAQTTTSQSVAAVGAGTAEPSQVYEASEPGDGQAWLGLAAALRFHWCCNGFLSEGRRQFERALTAVATPVPARATALWAAAWVAVMQGDLDTADRWLDEAAGLAEQLKDPQVLAYVQGVRGSSALYRGQPVQAAALLEDAVAAHALLNDGAQALQWLFQLALAQIYLDDPRAAATGRSAVITAEAHEERLSRSYALWVLGYQAWLRGNGQESNALMRSSLEIQRGFRDFAGVAATLEVLAWSTAALGDHAQAARLLGAVRPLTRELNPTSAGAFAEPHARCEQAIIAALGPAVYEKAITEGSSCDNPHRAIALALDTDHAVDQAVADPASHALTDREQDVAALVAQGMSNKQIATRLGRSPRTIDSHVQNILAKLAFGSRAQIATWWTENRAPAQ
ncbi:ATP-binding protein [Streptomyces geranii]|uniref:ATP-binding protein n=1 Tax=Streptomyces geranii TaxID=2058923 RepID=UPI000D02D52F|nr:LuxR C-terminal-related transcriptional regulator [Streptomyces geranii]